MSNANDMTPNQWPCEDCEGTGSGGLAPGRNAARDPGDWHDTLCDRCHGVGVDPEAEVYDHPRPVGTGRPTYIDQLMADLAGDPPPSVIDQLRRDQWPTVTTSITDDAEIRAMSIALGKIYAAALGGENV